MISADEFIAATGVTMNRPIHLCKSIAWWAEGIRDHCEYDRWFVVLEVNEKEICVIMHSSIDECTNGYIPNLADFLEKIQAVAMSDYIGYDDESHEEIMLWEATGAFTREQFCDLMDVDFASGWKEAYSGI